MVPFLGDGLGHGRAGLRTVNFHFALCTVDLHLSAGVELQHGALDRHLAVTTGHPLNVELLFHEITSEDQQGLTLVVVLRAACPGDTTTEVRNGIVIRVFRIARSKGPHGDSGNDPTRH